MPGSSLGRDQGKGSGCWDWRKSDWGRAIERMLQELTERWLGQSWREEAVWLQLEALQLPHSLTHYFDVCVQCTLHSVQNSVQYIVQCTLN